MIGLPDTTPRQVGALMKLYLQSGSGSPAALKSLETAVKSSGHAAVRDALGIANMTALLLNHGLSETLHECANRLDPLEKKRPLKPLTLEP